MKTSLSARTVFFALLCAFALSSPALAHDWPQWRGPNRDGISTEHGLSTDWPKEGPKQLWKAEVGAGFSSISVANGRLFTLSNRNETDTVYCLDAGTGKEIWKSSYPSRTDSKNEEWGPAATPTVEDDVLYTFGLRGQLICFEVATGKIRWQKNVERELGVQSPEWGFTSSPLIQGSVLFLNIGKGGAAFEKASGKVVWKSGRGPGAYCTPVPFKAGNESALAILGPNSIFAINAETGKELWRHAWPTPYGISIADPIISGDKLFVSSSYGKGAGLVQIGAGKPSQVWANMNMINHFNTCVLIDGHLYGINCDTKRIKEGNLRCVDFNTGEVKWTHEGTGAGTQMAVGNKLVALTGGGELIVAEATPSAFKPLARAQVLSGRCWTVPVFANGRLYCRNLQGSLVCLDVGTTRTAQLGK
ncbi:MAG: PQQ-like beta-propeller repeat protein [Verrucomicrobiales bacterium]|nr:PQQ-like beta-propeller repeat protein [Verrucomicrobiales bacterium]